MVKTRQQTYSFTKLSFAQALKEAVWILNPFVDGTKRLQDVVTDVTNDGQWRSAKDYIPEVRRLSWFRHECVYWSRD